MTVYKGKEDHSKFEYHSESLCIGTFHSLLCKFNLHYWEYTPYRFFDTATVRDKRKCRVCDKKQVKLIGQENWKTE